MQIKNKKRLKVLYIPSWYPSDKNTVAGIFIKEHAKAASLYNDVVVIYGESSERSLKKLWEIYSDKNEDDIRTIRIVYKKSPIRIITLIIYIWSVWRIFRKLLMEGWKPDLIHAHVYSAGIPSIILGKIYRIPVIITEHWSGFSRHTLSRFQLLGARFVMNRANMILPVSKSLEKAIKLYGINNKFEVVPNVVNTDLFYPSSTQKNTEGLKKILFVALLTPIKGVPYLLQALSRLREKRQDFILDVVGDGPNRKEYGELSRKLQLEDIVYFHGLKTKQEVAKFMKYSNFFVLPSEWENLPCVLIEAMSSGLPIVATKVGGIPEIINKKVGVLVPPKNVNALSKAIAYMLDHYKDYSAKAISEYANSNFSYEAVGKKLDNIYNEIVYKSGIKESKNDSVI